MKEKKERERERARTHSRCSHAKFLVGHHDSAVGFLEGDGGGGSASVVDGSMNTF